MDQPTAAPPRVHRFLEQEPVVWLSTVRPDGLPHLVPSWFWWDGEALLVFSKPHAVKVRNLRSNPRLMLAIGDAEADFDVGLVEAGAAVLDGPAPVPPEFWAKYRARLSEIGLSRETFLETYTQAVRIVPTRFLPWQGRGSSFRPTSQPGRLAAIAATLRGRGLGRLRLIGGPAGA